MKYLKRFEEHTDYTSYENGNEFITPNVSKCNDEGALEVHYTPHSARE